MHINVEVTYTSLILFLLLCPLVLTKSENHFSMNPHARPKHVNRYDFRKAPSGSGHFQNCGNTTWYTEWVPEPLLMGKSVTVKGSYTFPKEFKSAKVTILAGLYSPVPIHVTCQQLTANNKCAKGRTIQFDHEYTMPVLPSKLDNILVKIIAVDQDGYQMLCGKARISVH